MIITIDGPAGSGKSTLAAALAQHLHLFYLNSGYLYRGIAYVLITFYGYDEKELGDPNLNIIQDCIKSGDFRYEYKQGEAKVYFKDQEITKFLKDIDVSRAASLLGKNREVRNIIRKYKRALAEQNQNFVAEGRVSGSVVFPHADVKFYVTASEHVRAQRVQKLQKKRGDDLSLEEVLAQVAARDYSDMTRIHDPLIKPEDAIELDTSHLSKEQALQEALKHIK